MILSLFTRIVCIKVIYSSTFYEFSKRNSDIAYFVEYPVYSILKMYSLLFLVLLFWSTTIHSKWFCKSHLFLKFWVLWERSSAIALFVEHPLCNSFKMYAVLILFFVLFCFATIYSKRMCKSHFFWNTRYSAKEPMLKHLSPSNMYIAILKRLVSRY